MTPEARTPTADQLVLLTLALNLALAATLATMLARFGRFRRILLTEKRDWPERLVFAVGLGIPLMVGVIARVAVGYAAADLTLPGAFLAGLIAGPYAGAIVGAAVGLPPLFIREFGALPFAIGCGFAGGGLREICPKEEIWRFTPFFVTKLHQSAWRLMRNFTLDWQVVLVTAPALLELLRRNIPQTFPAATPHRHSPAPSSTSTRVRARGGWLSACSRRSSVSPFRSKSGTARGSNIGSPNRKSC